MTRRYFRAPLLSEEEFQRRLAAAVARHEQDRAAGRRIGRPLAVALPGWRMRTRPTDAADGAA